MAPTTRPITKEEGLTLLRKMTAALPGGNPSNNELHRMARQISKFLPVVLEGEEYFRAHKATLEQMLFWMAAFKKDTPYPELFREALHVVGK